MGKDKLTNYLLIGGIIVFLIPFSSLLLQNEKLTYLYLLKNITFPIYLIYYSAKWIYLTKYITNQENNVTILKERLGKRIKLEQTNIKNLNTQFDREERNLINKKKELIYVNLTLRIVTIITAFLIILSTIFLCEK